MQESRRAAWNGSKRLRRRLLSLALVAAAWTCCSGQSRDQRYDRDPNLKEILDYIHSGWDSLTRSTASCTGVPDPKVAAPPVIYLPADLQEPKELQDMQSHCKVTISHLPYVIHQLGSGAVEPIRPPGVLYLPNKYVVPGGRFNEMYGWDSYFIILGLLRDGRVELARGMVDNFFFEIEHYGALLNANRTYYLTRSHPPFLSSMVMAIHESLKNRGQDDREWLERAFEYMKRDHAMWTQGAHLAGDTGLSRYYDFGQGPAEEALQDETDTYRRVAVYFLIHPTVPNYVADAADVTGARAAGAPYSLRVCEEAHPDSCEPPRTVKLTPQYYKGDRSMRESGFDISSRFGPYGAATPQFAPVCLNSLLFKEEKDLEAISRILGKDSEIAVWRKAAEERKQTIQKYFWDERQGLFFDYNFETHQRSSYRYATTFYPLWAGLATDAQASAVVKNLGNFERPGGIAMSVQESQGQWDYPFGWAPIQMLAVTGMRRYGYGAEADRVSMEFLSTVLQNFARDKTIREKYNVVTRSADTVVKAGYAANVIGFGWTNAAFLELLHALPPEKASHLAQGTVVTSTQ